MPRKKCLPIGNSTEMDSKRPTKKPPAEAGDEARVLRTRGRGPFVTAESYEQTRDRKRGEAKQRAEIRAAEEKRWLANSISKGKRIKGRPQLFVRPSWEFTEIERQRFDRTHRVSELFDQVRPMVRPEDHELVFNTLGATVAFHSLSRLIERLEWDAADDVYSELENIRVGFELALQALDVSLADRGIALDARSKGGSSRKAPEWHAECMHLAKRLLEAGTEPHELAGKIKARLGRDEKTIRTVLKKAGIK